MNHSELMKRGKGKDCGEITKGLGVWGVWLRRLVFPCRRGVGEGHLNMFARVRLRRFGHFLEAKKDKRESPTGLYCLSAIGGAPR